MFIETNTENFLTILKEYKGDEIVIHYNCQECDDEQVTYPTEVDDDMIKQFEDKNELMVRYECTECSKNTLFLNIEYIQGIELY